MIRALLALLLMATTPALAADWGHYENIRFGYGLDLPPGFVAQGESDNGDGQMFVTPTASLTVYGTHIPEGAFEAAVAQRQRASEDAGWGITYQVSTPDNASYSGKKGARILYVRLVSLCHGSEMAAFELNYSRSDIGAFDAVVTRMVRSFAATGKALDCR